MVFFTFEDMLVSDDSFLLLERSSLVLGSTTGVLVPFAVRFRLAVEVEGPL